MRIPEYKYKTNEILTKILPELRAQALAALDSDKDDDRMDLMDKVLEVTAPRLTAVGVCVCTDEGVFLSTKLRGEYAGRLQNPGGRLEVTDHSLAHAAARELWEETGLEVDPENLVQTLGCVRKNTKGELFDFCGYAFHLPEGKTLQRTEPDKSSDWKLVTWNDVEENPDVYQNLIPGITVEVARARFELGL